MSARGFFSNDYFTARQRFLATAVEHGLAMESFPHPTVSDGAGEIATDVARLGASGADKVLFVLSGVHGTELTAGSGLQPH